MSRIGRLGNKASGALMNAAEIPAERPGQSAVRSIELFHPDFACHRTNAKRAEDNPRPLSCLHPKLERYWRRRVAVGHNANLCPGWNPGTLDRIGIRIGLPRLQKERVKGASGS